MWEWSQFARLKQRGILRPLFSRRPRGNGRNLPGYNSVAFCDQMFGVSGLEMVGNCQAATEWHFSTVFSGMAYKNGRDLPGCRTEANHDRFWVRWHGLCRLRGAQRLRGARRLQTSGACGGARRLRDARRLRGPIQRLQSARPGFRRRYSSRSNSSLGSRGRPE